MSNMSYCRFENTVSDLRDCEDQLRMLLEPGYTDGAEESPVPDRMSSPQEEQARVRLVETVLDLAALFADTEVDGARDRRLAIENVLREGEARFREPGF